MDKAKFKELLAKWSAVEDYQRLAVELWKVTNGDARQLAGTHTHEKSAFGRAATNLFEENVVLHRYLLWSIWKSNKGDIREHFAMVARQEGQRKNLRGTPYGSKEKSKNVMCWCRFSIQVTAGKNLSTVQCSQCKEYFHSICAGISEEETEIEDYVCLQCTKTPSIPRLFLEPLRNKDTSMTRDKDGARSSKTTPGRFVSQMGKFLFPGTPRGRKSNPEACTSSQDEPLSLGNDLTGDDLLPPPTQSNNGSDNESLLSINSNQEKEIESDTSVEVILDKDSPKKKLSRTRFNWFGKTKRVNPVASSDSEDGPDMSSHKPVKEPRQSKVSPGFDSDSDFKESSVRGNKKSVHKDSIHVGFSKGKPMKGKLSNGSHSDSDADVNPSRDNPNENDEDWVTSESDGEERKKDKEGTKKKKHLAGPSRVIGAKVDCTKLPVSWIRKFTKAEYLEILAFNNETKRWGFALNYGDALQDRLTERNDVCVIRVTKRELVQPGDKDFPNKQFLAVYAECKGDYCSARFSFNIKQYPMDTNSVEMLIKVCGGKFKHFEREENKRNLSGKRRKQVKNELMHKLPSNVYRQLWTKSDVSKAQKGNINSIKKLKNYQQCRVEKRKEQDHYANVLLDLHATMDSLADRNTKARVPGYMQDLATRPLKVILYTQESIQLFRKFARQGKVTLFMDSTANMAKSIEYPQVVPMKKNADGSIRKKKKPRIFYYAIVLKSQSGKSVPILEFFSDKQDFLSINYCMEHFFQTYKRLYNVRSFNYNVSRLEIDFSLASLSAATRVFAGQDVEQYLRSVWSALKDRQKMKFTVHICRIHTVKFLTKFFETTFKAARVWDKGSSYFIKWVHRFVAAKTMDEVSKLLEEVFTVLSTKYRTAEIDDILAGNFEGRIWARWRNFNIRNINEDDPFYLRTPFGAFYNDMADRLYELNNELEGSNSELPPNDFFSVPIMRYFREKMTPYAYLLSKVPFLLTDSSFVGDNTNASETWNKVVKTDILGGQRHQKLSRVIRALSENVLGALLEALSRFPISTTGNDTMVELSDDSSDTDDDEDESEADDSFKADDSCKADRDSPDEAVDQFKTERRKKAEPSSTILKEMELIPSGGMYKGTKLYNTCSFDCILQALYYLYNFTDFGRMFIDDLLEEGGVSQYLPSIFQKISKKKFAEAKAIWIRNVLQKDITGRCMDLWEEELEQGLKPLKGFFPIIQRVDCPNRHCNANRNPPRQLDSTYFLSSRQEDFEEVLEIGNKKTCKVCKSATARLYYNMKPGHNYGVFAYAHIGMERKYVQKINKKGEKYFELEKQIPTFPESKLEHSMQLFNTRFRVVCYTIYNGIHYKLVIVEPTHKLVYDGQNADKLQKWNGPDDNYSVSTIWLSPV